jgi:hypothetical protein
MSVLGKKLRSLEGGIVAFECLGCGCGHAIPVAAEPPSRNWQWNGNADAPTFTPSILVTYPANPDAIEEFKEWRTERRCHSFVINGQIQYLPDSTHKFAGKTIELPDWDE